MADRRADAMSHANERDAARDATVVAALGPTNTGKTHRAVERMLDHATGMMGLPLRLLAREVYDRVAERLGQARVALVTGEEKRVPPKADYWICTVEAMPLDLEVDFLAIDEVQLAAHRERGHVFTDRLLRARGRRETWFLGAETMRPMISAVLPGATHRRFERFSELRHVPPRSPKRLPPRTAVVAFSAERVYELAALLRRLRGGVAVVLGALSPRTRNAQVAMYQAGEVNYLVATDAIGMGLNLDVNHVAFADVRKFDGRAHRPLALDELGQIAGRAGRHLSDGTFGTLRPLDAFSPAAVAAIERHRYPPVRELFYRSAALDFRSIDALVASLSAPPPRPFLRRVERADDFDALQAVARMDGVREKVRSERDVSLLWDVCRIPDYRKLLLERHAALVHDVFIQLAGARGRIDESWFARQVTRLDDRQGDVDALTARLAAIRTWSYVSQQGAWLEDAAHWRERTRAIEDALGDALHARLVDRFVERDARTRRLPFIRHRAGEPESSTDGPFAKLRALHEQLDPRAKTETETSFVERIVAADTGDFELERTGRIRFEGTLLARLVAGKDVTQPGIALEMPESFTAGSRTRLETRLRALARDFVAEASGGFSPAWVPAAHASPSARALAYLLERGLGVATKVEARAPLASLRADERATFSRLGVREGRRYVYVEAALSPTALVRKWVLVSLVHPAGEFVPAEPITSRHTFPGVAEARLYGYDASTTPAVRVDLVERLADALGHAHESAAAAGRVTRWLEELALPPDAAERWLTALGARLGPDGRSFASAPGDRPKKRRRRRRKRATPRQPPQDA